MSYYKVIDGVKYDRRLLEFAESLTQGKGDGRISQEDAEQILEIAQDARLLTPIEYRTLQYILDNMKFTEKAAQWLREQLNTKSPFERLLNSIVREGFGLKNLRLNIDEAEVNRQMNAFANPVGFPLALREMINHFINGGDSSTSVRDIAYLEKGIDFEDMEASRPKIKALIDEGTLQLFPIEYLELIQNGQLDFKFPIFEQPINEYWAFGLTTPAFPGYYFIGFVNREDWYDVYHTGYQ